MIRAAHKNRWLNPEEAGLVWLGQAGFWIQTPKHKILIDPYLSDSLAKKYAGQKNDHKRMVEAPLAPQDLPRPDLVLVTHAHTDHMDSETLAPLAQRFDDLPFVVPRAKITEAKARIGQDANLILADAGEVMELNNGLKIHAFPAAHEDRKRDENGHHEFLGYGIEAGDLRIYHSGDTVPFDDLTSAVHAFAPQIMLLPVNGRDAARLQAGIPGNLTLDEAYALAAPADVFVPHHWGMFAFNTIAPDAIANFAKTKPRSNLVLPIHGGSIVLEESRN